MKICSGRYWSVWQFALAALFLLYVATGCSNAPHSEKVTGSVTAKVTYGGEPVTEGSVNLENPSTGLGGGADLDASGLATLKTVPVGDYTITVVPPLPPQDDPNPEIKEYDNLPQKYRSSATSTLKATVTEGENQFEFELKD